MVDLPSHPDGLGAEVPQTLTDRVLARVGAAGRAVDRRASAPRRKPARSEPAPSDPLSANLTRTPAQIREARSLRWVFRDLGKSYRKYRRRTGAPVSSDVRAAAYRFRHQLDVASLVSLAACLDELEILTW
jgi:hypothetical protein